MSKGPANIASIRELEVETVTAVPELEPPVVQESASHPPPVPSSEQIRDDTATDAKSPELNKSTEPQSAHDQGSKTPMTELDQPEGKTGAPTSNPFDGTKKTFLVDMHCNGCMKVVEDRLEKAKVEGDGIDAYEVTLSAKTVNVWGSITQERLKEVIAETKREIIYP